MFPCLKLRKLEERLQCIDDFTNPKVKLEQYVTPSHLGSHMLYTIQSQYGDISGKLVADLGCGCGGLTIGAAVLDAGLVVGFEVDYDALEILQGNISDHELTNIDSVLCDIRNIPNRFVKAFDTVLMNPPFGTKNNEGIDMKFLEVACSLSRKAVYSLHKTSTRSHVLKYASSLNVKGEVLAKLQYDLPSTYKFHKKSSVDIEVDFYSINTVIMSAKEYSRDHCKIAVAKILSTIGWHSINSTPLEILTDILGRYIEQIAKVTNDYSNEFGQTEPNLDHLGLAFQELGVNLPELEEYVTYVNFIPSSHPVPKFPLPKESNLNFLKPGSKEVVTRPVHINEHLPPMFPLLEEQSDNADNLSPVKKESAEENGCETSSQFKKPADVSTLEFKKIKKEEENGRPTREITSVMMTTSGFLSPAREGKLPEAKAPAPPPEPPKPPSPVLPVPELVPMVKKKPEKKKDRVGKALFKPLPDEKMPPKKLNNMKDILKMKQIKAMMNSQGMGVAAQPPQHFLPHHMFPGGQQAPPLVHHTAKPHVVKSSSFNKALAAAKAKTEKLNTTITPIPIKSEPPSQFHLPMHVDKLVTEPDRKKINILRKISNVKDKHDKSSRPRLNPHLIQQTQEIVNKINLSSDITIEPINPPLGMHSSSVKTEPYFEMGSPPGTPPTPRTPEIMAQNPPIVVKEKRKRKEKPEKPKVKRAKKQPQPHFIDSDILDMTMGRPKTPEAQLLVRHKPPVGFGPLPVPPTAPMPFPFLANLVGGPSLIPPPLNSHLYPFPPIPDFGKTPYFPSPKPKPEPTPKISPRPKEVKPEPADVVPLPVPTPAANMVSPTPREPSPLPPIKEQSIPSGSASPIKVETPKKSKEHKKEKKDKIKKKNKKEKVKDKSEKKKLKEAKKEKEKIKKEKKKKVPKEEPLSIEIPPPSVPRLLLKVSNPDSPRPETPEPKKLNIKPVVKKEESVAERKHREPSPGLAKISALVTGPPKPKNAPTVSEKPSVEIPVSPSVSSRPPGRPRIHPPKPKPPPKRKVSGPPFMTVDADGKEIWYCPECKEENDERDMIGCDDCDAWYHWVCVGIQVPPDDSENWYCKPCLAKKNEDLQDKKKKRKKKEKNH